MVHLWRRNKDGTSVLFDDETLALVEVDDLTARLIMQESGAGALQSVSADAPAEELAASTDIIKRLKKSGAILARPRDAVVEPQLAYLVLNLAHACNLECRYCFAEGGGYGSEAELMPEEVALKAIELLAASPSEGPKSVILFGGEPLCNPDVLRSSVKLIRELIGDASKANISISTNGMLLSPEMADFLVTNEVRIQVSLDGLAPLHDRLRPTKDGKGSYEPAMKNVGPLLEEGRSLHARASATSLCCDPVSLAAQLLAPGFKSVSIQPVNGSAYEPSLDDMQRLAHGYEALLASGLAFRIPYLQRFVDKMKNRGLTKTFCGAGVRGTAVAPNGEMYFCHRFAGRADFRVGSVREGFLPDRVREILRNRRTVDDPLTCSVCDVRNLCGGGCAAENFFANGDVSLPWHKRCVLTKAVAHAAIDYVIDGIYASPEAVDQEETGGDTAGQRESA